METQPKYCIYPTLLIGFQSLLDYELAAEEDWNKVTEAAHNRGEHLDKEIGDYKLTPDEMYLKLECDLLDTVNRVDGDYCEAAARGTAFNEIVDCLIENRRSRLPNCDIRTAANASGTRVIRADIDGYSFDFDISLCREAAREFKGSLTQFMAKSTIGTKYGSVCLYGYIDEWCGNKMYDIKTTSRYAWGKYERGWQRYVYPWCVIEAGETTEVESFTYWIVEWAHQPKGMPLTAKGIYREEYTYDHEDATMKIRNMVESFIEWLESRRDFIQDKRIFGGENPVGWHGQPTDMRELEKAIFKEIA